MKAFLPADYAHAAQTHKARADHLAKMIRDAVHTGRATELGSKSKRFDLVLAILESTIAVDKLLDAVEEQKKW